MRIFLSLILIALSACATYEKDQNDISWKRSERCDGLKKEYENVQLYLVELANLGGKYTAKCSNDKNAAFINKYKNELVKFREFQDTNAMTSWAYNLHHCTQTKTDSSEAMQLLYSKWGGDVLSSVYKTYYTCSGEKPLSRDEIMANKFPKALEEMARFQAKHIRYFID